MSLFSMDAGSMAELWSLNPEANDAHPFKISGEFEIESDGLFVLNGFW